MKVLNFFVLIFLLIEVKAQVTIGDLKSPESFSILELVSDGKFGLRIPQLTNDERDDIVRSGVLSGNILAEGLVIYNKDTKCIEFWSGTQWVAQCAPTSLGLDGGLILASNASIKAGSAPNEILGIAPAIGGYMPYVYEWQYCTGEPSIESNWKRAADGCGAVANKPHYQPCVLNNTTFFRRKVTDDSGASRVTNVVKIKVELQAGMLTQPAQLPASGAVTSIIGTPSSGGNAAGFYLYQWEYCRNGCDNNANWYAVNNPAGGYSCSNSGIGQDYTTCFITTDTQFRRCDSDGEQNAVSNIVIAALSKALPKATAADIDATLSEPSVCAGSSITITASLKSSALPAPNTIFYLYDSNGTLLASDNTAPFTFTVYPAILPVSGYFLAFTSDNHDANLSSDRKAVLIPVTEKTTPSILINTTAFGVSTTENVTFTAFATHGGSNPQYIWKVDGVTKQSGASNIYTTVFSVAGTRNVTCELTSNASCVTTTKATSNAITVVSVITNRSCAECQNFLKTTSAYAQTTYKYGVFYATGYGGNGACLLLENPMGSAGGMHVFVWNPYAQPAKYIPGVMEGGNTSPNTGCGFQLR